MMIIDRGTFSRLPGGDAINAAGVVWREHVNSRVLFNEVGSVFALAEDDGVTPVTGSRLFVEIDNGGIVSFVSSDPSRLVPIERRVIETDTAVSVGMVYADGAFQPAPVPSNVPIEVTMRQAKLALLRAGLLTGADAAIAQLPGEVGDEARIEWEYAATLRRDHPLVQALGSQLGISADQTDALFVAAAAI